jgi:hypothetical protein
LNSISVASIIAAIPPEVDAACLTALPEESVTLMIMALSLRAGELLAKEIQLGKV